MNSDQFQIEAACFYALLLLIILQARFCTSVLVEELSDVCQCRAEILEPKKLSQDNFTKFVSSLALSVHIGAALYSVTLGNKIAVQVLNYPVINLPLSIHCTWRCVL